ncbi:hypothetical protein ABZ362_27260, partial [Streptomyces sp. NPDC005951]|uniref:hypothetical protein n=1 Tax=Streptomyces sp. NPDC005951 TaxID=3154573 RepID=UPI003401F7E5
LRMDGTSVIAYKEAPYDKGGQVAHPSGGVGGAGRTVPGTAVAAPLPTSAVTVVPWEVSAG